MDQRPDDPLPICISCGGTGVAPDFEEPALDRVPEEDREEWRRHLVARDKILHRLDRILANRYTELQDIAEGELFQYLRTMVSDASTKQETGPRSSLLELLVVVTWLLECSYAGQGEAGE